MAKKTHKKQSFKYAQPTANVDATRTSPVVENALTPTRTSNAVVSITVNDNPYLRKDLAKLGIIAVSLIILEFVLWTLFSHTSVGSSVYNLYKIGS